MQFTPQQLVGAGRYAPCTRIGNWNEDLMLEEARMKEFQLRKQQGSLLSTHKLKQDFLAQRTVRSFDPTQRIRWNQSLALQHMESNGLLSCNVFEETPSIGSNEFLITVTCASSSVARNTFRIVSPTAYKAAASSDQGVDLSAVGESVKYGEPFLLMCHETLLIDDQSVLLRPPLFLKSGLKTERSMSPISYQQRVWLATDADSSALWVCERADAAGTEKFLASGQEIKAGDLITIVHKMTGQPLFADQKHKQPTDHGVEIEVCGFGAKSAGKHHNLAAEATGLRTADTEGRMSLLPNTWTFVLNTKQESTENPYLPAFATPASVVNVIRRCVMSKSIYAFRQFLLEMMRVDAKQTGFVDAEEFNWLLLRHYKMPLREEHVDVLVAALDKRRTGHFALRDLLEKLRVPLSRPKQQQIEAAFERLSASKGGKLTAAVVVDLYDPSIDARVRHNEINEHQAKEEYRALFQTPTGEITRAQFTEVYGDIAAAIENDQLFAQLLQESWRM